ncbi:MULTISPECIES: hypothetical protein [Methylobacterium]|uniref:hypothetical protein n=1 Tax=Methylobacterium TaxID=407 RepID=UPI0013EB7790|nr:hypothetical protein [Methylobacterium sp. DB0501]NGM36819.1 hypothetical protein [Methylobacterium sp. DB0501]
METTRLDDVAAEAAPLFENRDWRLHADGLEHRETGYFIDRDALSARRPDGYWEWPLHLSEKSWCGVRSFREAFSAALQAFGIAPDRKLTLSFALGFGTRVGGAAPDAFVPLAELVRLRAPAPRSVAAIRPLVAASA